MIQVAALYVDRSGAYSGMDSIELWDETRDARLYPGPYPVVAHPPCSRWCRLAGLVQARWGHKIGDDGGCFSSALDSVRRWGGVLEHPAYTKAWAAHELPDPGYTGWQGTLCGGWVCYVEQGRYGHPAKKATWLYAYGSQVPPPLRFGLMADGESQALVSWCGNHTKASEVRPRLSQKEASRTPPEFRDDLLAIAKRPWLGLDGQEIPKSHLKQVAHAHRILSHANVREVNKIYTP